MGRQWNKIIDSLGPLTGGTVSINANLGDIDALLTTIQADIADGIIVSSGSSVVTNGSLAQVTSATAALTAGTLTTGTVTANIADGSGNSITSTSIGATRRLDVNLSSAGTTGSAVPITANLYAGTDGTNLRAISVDTNGRVNTNITSATATITNGTITTGTIAQLTNGTVSASVTGGTITTGTIAQLTNGTVTSQPFRGSTTIGTLTAGTTNGTLFATNSTRNYLLVQCTSGTAYLDTNGTATAGDGILLTSGQGITFEGSFIPTGAISAITSTGTARLIGRQG